MKKKKGTWGGKRVSTKPKKEKTKPVRIPLSRIDDVKTFLGKDK